MPQEPPPSGRPSREPAIDQLRGYAIMAMIATHAAGSTPLYRLTHPTGPLSAASLFILLAGVVLGMIAGRRQSKGTLEAMRLPLLRRAGQLWLVQAALVCLYLITHLCIAPVDILGAMPAPWWRGLLAFVTLWWRPTYFDILPLYIFLMLAMVILIEAIRGGWLTGAATVSLGLYVAGQFDDATTAGFSLMSWQVLFVLGVLAGLHRDRMRAAASWIVPAAMVTLVATAALAAFGPEEVQRWMFARRTLGVGRLLHAMALVVAGLWFLEQAARWPLAATVLAPLGTLGRHSLLAFCTHLVVLLPLIVSTSHRWPAADQMIAAAAMLVIVYAVAAMADRRTPAVRSPAA